MNRLEQFLIGTLMLIALAAAGWLGLQHYGEARFAAGRADAIAERAEVDAKAVLTRAGENKAKEAQQALDNLDITKEKDHEIADLRQRLAAAGRLHVGPSVCPDRPAAPTQAEGAAGGDGADPSAGLVSSRADEDFKQLIEAVETDLSTGRACQAFIEKNGLVP